MAKSIKDYKEDLKGVDFLRRLVNWSNYRHEYLNENKTPIQLINEFLKYENGITDVDGTVYED